MESIPTVVQVVVINDEGDSCYRMRWPGMHLAVQAPAWRIINLDAHSAERHTWAGHADLLVLYQPADPDLLELIARRRAQGKKTLVELNDNYYAPPAASPASEAWSSPLLWQTYEAYLEEADGVVVTGPGLERLLQPQNPRALHILENHLASPPPDFDQARHDAGGEVRLGWAGSLGHIADILSIKRVIERLLEAYPHLVFCVMGNEALPRELGLPEQRLRYTPWGAMDDYYAFLERLHIGLAPLLPTPYNECRSDIKAVEIASRSVVPLLTQALPYEHFLAATDAPSYRTLDELETLARRYIEHSEMRREQARRCYEYVVQRRLGEGREERLALYREYLPATLSSFTWNLSTGYHEVRGTREEYSPYRRRHQAIHQFMQAKRWLHAAREAAAALADYPHDADTALLAVKCQARTARTEALNAAADLRRRFPNDLRFALTQTLLEREADTQRTAWKDVLAELKRHDTVYRAYFAEMVVTAFCRHLRKDGSAADLAESLLELYPYAAELHFELFRYYERHGRDEDARRHVAFLMQERQRRRGHRAFFDSVNEGYLGAWHAALEGRRAAPADGAVIPD